MVLKKRKSEIRIFDDVDAKKVVVEIKSYTLIGEKALLELLEKDDTYVTV